MSSRHTQSSVVFTTNIAEFNFRYTQPLLIVDGRVLSESVAIQTWIARTFPQAKLLPADP